MQGNPNEMTSKGSTQALVESYFTRSSIANRAVRTAMRDATAVRYDAPLSRVSWSLATAKSQVAFVVDDDLRPLGMVTPTHLLQRASGRSRASLQRLRASDAATSEQICIDADATLDEAAQIVATYGVRWLAVCEQGKLLGSLSAEDVVRAAWLSDEWD